MAKFFSAIFGLIFLAFCHAEEIESFDSLLGCNPGLRSVCYDELGCFDNAPPFNAAKNCVPQSPDQVKTTFRLFTRQNRDQPALLDYNNEQTLRNSAYDPQKPTRYIVHGWTGSADNDWILELVPVLLDKEDSNAIVVDWSAGAKLLYAQACANTRLVGAQIARMVNKLGQVFNHPTYDNVHIVGHSLGSHVAGFAGERILNLGRITALDPAEPNFESSIPITRLDPSDASFVDVIHTDGNPFREKFGLGILEPVGHVDFYPNGGRVQSGCPEEVFGTTVLQFLKNGLSGAADNFACSHQRAPWLFLESIKQTGNHMRTFSCASEEEYLLGHCLKCSDAGLDCPTFGFHVPKHTARGSFYFNTTSVRPYFAHHYRLHLIVSNDYNLAFGRLTINLKTADGKVAFSTIYKDNKDIKFNRNEHKKSILLSHSALSGIVSAELTFTKGSGIWAGFSRDALKLKELTITGLNEESIFSRSDLTLENKRVVTV